MARVGETHRGNGYEEIHARGICPEGHRGAYGPVYVPRDIVLRVNGKLPSSAS